MAVRVVRNLQVVRLVIPVDNIIELDLPSTRRRVGRACGIECTAQRCCDGDAFDDLRNVDRDVGPRRVRRDLVSLVAGRVGARPRAVPAELVACEGADGEGGREREVVESVSHGYAFSG